MKKIIKQISRFSKEVDSLICNGKLLLEDFEDFKKDVLEHPDQGDLIAGTGGVRKTRLKSASKGKSGGFRVCYIDLDAKGILYLLLIYPKNRMENIDRQHKNALKELVKILKES